MKRQIKEVDEIMARNEQERIAGQDISQWRKNHRRYPPLAKWATDLADAHERLNEADAKLPDAQIRERLLPIDYMDRPFWYERIDWRFVGIVLGITALDLALVYVVIRACEAFAKFTEAI